MNLIYSIYIKGLPIAGVIGAVGLIVSLAISYMFPNISTRDRIYACVDLATWVIFWPLVPLFIYLQYKETKRIEKVHVERYGSDD